MKALNRFMVFGSSVLLGLMALHMTADALSSYLFDYPIDGTIELVSRYYMIAIVYLSMAYVQSRDQHIVAEIFSDGFSARFSCLCQCLTQLLFIGFGVLLVWRGSIDAVRNTMISESTQTITGTLMVWPSRWIVVASGIMIVLQSGLMLLNEVRRR
ncbi:TRAP transporter small permease [Alcaligenaceae bacterium CGII-47]|nr:TRAP transporter small permease [Alcaligenaceae bacterium CGII-47]